MISIKPQCATYWLFTAMLLFSGSGAVAQNQCYNLPKAVAPQLTALLKGQNNSFLTYRSTHDYVVEQTQKLPDDAEKKEALLADKYFKYLGEVEADLKTLRKTFRTKGILTSNLRISGGILNESQILKSNRSKKPFAVPLPKKEQIHLEVRSVLFVVDNNAGSYSKRMLITAYILENNGSLSLLKIDSNPVSDLSDQEKLIKNFRVKLPELLSYASYGGDELDNVHVPGKEAAMVQVNGEGSTTVLVKSDEGIRGLLAHSSTVKITLAVSISRSALPRSLNEIQGALSLFGEGVGYEMNSLTGRIEKDKEIPVIYAFINQIPFKKEGDDIVKYLRFCYSRDGKAGSIASRLVISPDDSGTYRMDLIVGKVDN